MNSQNERMKLTFRLNHQCVEIDTLPDRRVVDLLREELGMTGVKEGCGSGECGACSILVNGELRLSCLMLAAQLQGVDVITIEGLAQNGSLHPVQQAFIDNGAVQCGFCTPGMVLAAVHLLRHHPEPSLDEIREGVSGNLCRCTGYTKIVNAIQEAAEILKEQSSRSCP